MSQCIPKNTESNTSKAQKHIYSYIRQMIRYLQAKQIADFLNVPPIDAIAEVYAYAPEQVPTWNYIYPVIVSDNLSTFSSSGWPIARNLTCRIVVVPKWTMDAWERPEGIANDIMESIENEIMNIWLPTKYVAIDGIRIAIWNSSKVELWFVNSRKVWALNYTFIYSPQ